MRSFPTCRHEMETAGIEPALKSPRVPPVPSGTKVDPEFEPWLTRWTWRLERNAERAGKSYVVRHTTLKGRQVRIYLHRAVLGLEPGDPRRADHVNGDTLDCRRANLRIVTVAQNAQNQGSRGGSSRYRGVTWDKRDGKWLASVMLNGRRANLGRFESEEEAGRIAAAYRAEHMPFSAEGMARREAA